MQQNKPANIFQSALTHFQQRQHSQAERICDKMLQVTPESADFLHLKALCIGQRDPSAASVYFEKAIIAAPSNLAYKKNYANFLFTNGDLNRALTLYSELQLSSPKDIDIAYGIAFIQYQHKRYRKTLEIISNHSLSTQDLPKWQILEARALLECGETIAAEECLTRALKSAPHHGGLMMTKVLLLRQQQQPEHAMRILSAMSKTPVKDFLTGCLYHDLQQYELAEKHLKDAIAQQTDYIDAHIALNKLYWEHNQDSQFLGSFQQALAKVPTSVSLYMTYISHLLKADKVELAIDVTLKGLKACGEQPPLLHALGTLYYNQKKYDDALRLFERSLILSPNNVRYLLDKANILIKSSQYNDALDLLTQAVNIEPDNQEVWAYLGLCWRFIDISKYQWLNNYKQLVSVKKLQTPPGYKHFSDFWQELKKEVTALHTSEKQPLDQSVRHGTQTAGFLFNNQSKAIKAYQNLLVGHLNEYITSLPQDSTHPLLRRTSENFRFSGCWSVKLHDSGFHTNHVHPQGWLSVCTYLQVPKTISPDDPQQQGWLRIGRTSLNLEEREETAYSICPEEGLCVIFPSYSWHGTVPFSGDGERITLPCDVIPDV